MATWSIELPSGAEYELISANGVRVRQVLGDRMAPVENISTNYALIDGALHQRTAVRPRILTLILAVTGSSVATLLALEDALVTAVNPHRGSQPVQIWYRSGAGGTGRYIWGYYEGGLEGIGYKGYTANPLPLRFRCDDPFWYYETPIAGQALTIRSALANVNYMMERTSYGGAWNNMDTGADFQGYDAAYAATDKLYVAGIFDNVGAPAVPASGIALWNGTDWSALGTGLTGGTTCGYCLVLNAAGYPYVGGNFTTANGVACKNIARWTGATFAALGAGLDDTVNCLAINAAGDLYAGGDFQNVPAGIAVKYIAKWTVATATWSVVGAGLDSSVMALAVAPNGDIYAGGAFHNVAGPGLAVSHIAMWDVSAGAWVALGAGVNGDVQGLKIASNGDLYAAGAFTTAGGVAANRIAKWNGISWCALGDGLDDWASELVFDDSGRLWVGGGFRSAGGNSTPLGLAVWQEGIWLPGDAGGAFGAGTTNALAVLHGTDKLVISGGFVINPAYVAGDTTITTTCSARAYPIFTVTGPGRLYYLINSTTGQAIYFNIDLVASEVLTIDLRLGHRAITSSFRGDMYPGIIAGTLTNWYLQPGANHVGCYVDNAAATAVYGYTPRYWGAA